MLIRTCILVSRGNRRRRYVGAFSGVWFKLQHIFLFYLISIWFIGTVAFLGIFWTLYQFKYAPRGCYVRCTGGNMTIINLFVIHLFVSILNHHIFDNINNISNFTSSDIMHGQSPTVNYAWFPFPITAIDNKPLVYRKSHSWITADHQHTW